AQIEFKDCHTLTLKELSDRIKCAMEIIVYCCKKSEELKTEHPYLADFGDKAFMTLNDGDAYARPHFARPAISLSNIGHWGYETADAPLLPNETAKFTLTKVERKQLWNNQSKQFEVQDMVPVCMSIDHRVFDGNVAVPHLLQATFNDMVNKMIQKEPSTSTHRSKFSNLAQFVLYSDELLNNDLELGFHYLFISSLYWKNEALKQPISVRTADIKDCVL
ncbi:MAG: 2-oxo acid dehydrogenase subunit E2, partial [Legionellales bacterium]